MNLIHARSLGAYAFVATDLHILRMMLGVVAVMCAVTSVVYVGVGATSRVDAAYAMANASIVAVLTGNAR